MPISNVVDWKKWSKYLGTMQDKLLASIIGVTPGAVKFQRDKLKIPVYNMKNINWDKIPYGTLPDIELAEKYNVTREVIRYHRRQRNINPYERKKTTKLIWKDEWLKLLGTMFDTKLAKIIGCNKATVCAKRSELNIKPYTGKRSVFWTDEYVNMLGKISDRELSHIMNCSSFSVQQERINRNIPVYENCTHKNIKWDDQPLGKMTDKELASILNVTYNVVRQARLVRFIRPYKK